MAGWRGGVAAALALAALAGERAPAPRTRPVWRTDYAQARAVARTSDRPLFVVFRCEH